MFTVFHKHKNSAADGSIPARQLLLKSSNAAYRLPCACKPVRPDSGKPNLTHRFDEILPVLTPGGGKVEANQQKI